MTKQTLAPTRRRSLAPATALVGAAAWLAFVALTAAQRPYGWPGIASLLLLGACWLGCRFLIGDIAERRVDEVDEYELDQRNAARNVGYAMGLGSLVVLFLLATTADRLAERGHSALLDQLPPLVFAALLLAAATPSFLLAWRARDRSAKLDEESLL